MEKSPKIYGYPRRIRETGQVKSVRLDPARKPSEVLEFYGVKQGDKVADIWAASWLLYRDSFSGGRPERSGLFGKSHRAAGVR